MTYKLYSATDTRDSRPMLWLHCTHTAKVAQFHPQNGSLAHQAPDGSCTGRAHLVARGRLGETRNQR